MSDNDTALDGAAAEDVFAAITRLAGIGDLEAAASAYEDEMLAAYWDDKDLEFVTGVGFAGASRLLSEADRLPEQQAADVKGTAKAMLFNIASFTWPGWNEPGIDVSATQAAAGLEAARLNLSLAVQLDKGPLAESRGHWMVGAHLLTGGEAAAALSEFELAAAKAGEADASLEAQLSDAFAGLAIYASCGDESRMAAALRFLQADEDGEGLAEQVTTAKAVLDGG